MTSDPVASKAPAADFPLDRRVAERWSPRGFDDSHEVSRDDIGSLLEAARWSASASNTQPWRFIVARRGTDDFAVVVHALIPWNAEWAHRASLLVVCCTRTVDDDGRVLRWAAHDLGQAVAWLTVQAESMGLSVHQMGGFDAGAITRAFGLDEATEPVVVAAVGRFDAQADLTESVRKRELAARERLPLADLVVRGWPLD